MGSSDSLYHCQVCRIRMVCTIFLWQYLHQRKGKLRKTYPTWNHFRLRISCWYFLRYRVSPRWHHRLQALFQGQRGRHHWTEDQQNLCWDRIQGLVGWSSYQNFDDRYPYWPPMVDLRYFQDRSRPPDYRRWKQPQEELIMLTYIYFNPHDYS